jgi:hypothetical protein
MTSQREGREIQLLVLDISCSISGREELLATNCTNDRGGKNGQRRGLAGGGAEKRTCMACFIAYN